MKSFIKKFLLIAVACISIASIMMLVACGGTDKPADTNSSSSVENSSGSNGTEGTDGVKHYTFEAEYCCADEWSGAGWSGSQSGTGLIVRDKNNIGASNGHFLTYTWSAGLHVYFEISAREAAKATLSLCLGNEIGAQQLNPDRFAVVVNDEDIEYDEFTLLAGDAETVSATRIDDYLIGEIDLVEGENIISLYVGEFKFDESHNFGPVIDAIKLDTTASLSMLEYTDNLRFVE